jgi:isoquinoline 1-oxidoreductase alpha subunit
MKLTVNGKAVTLDADPDMPLLWALREDLQLTGTKFGCGMALCGACTVHLDGQPVRACQTPLSAAAGKKITTIEGVGSTKVGKAVQAAWVAQDVPQCGYCQSGQIMAAAALLKASPNPTDEEIHREMSNICRCGTYNRIRAAIKQAATARG